MQFNLSSKDTDMHLQAKLMCTKWIPRICVSLQSPIFENLSSDMWKVASKAGIDFD